MRALTSNNIFRFLGFINRIDSIDQIELIEMTNSLDFCLIAFQDDFHVQVQNIPSSLVSFIEFMHSLVQAFIELGFGVLLYLFYEV